MKNIDEIKKFVNEYFGRALSMAQYTVATKYFLYTEIFSGPFSNYGKAALCELRDFFTCKDENGSLHFTPGRDSDSGERTKN